VKRSASRFVLLLLLSLVSVFFPQIHIANAQLSVTIHADGTISPEYAPVQRNGNIYTLIDGMNHLIVDGSNIIIDGNGMHLESDRGTETIICLHNVRNVTVKNCVIGKSDFGIVLDSVSGITITGNIITEADIVMWEAAAIYIKGETSNIKIVGNTIKNNKWGIMVYAESPNLIIYHNNFVDNIRQDLYVGSGYISSFSARWDNGTAGNHWSNYNGSDTNGDGVGDTPYVIDTNNQDRYPLMMPVDITDINSPAPSPSPALSPTPNTTDTPIPSPTASPSPESTPETPEFSSWILLSLFITVVTGVILLVYFKKRKH
jgi:parallel beta-helix repeat protein